jgi:hypothetical protein
VCVAPAPRSAFHSMLSGPLSELLGRADITMGQTMGSPFSCRESIYFMCSASRSPPPPLAQSACLNFILHYYYFAMPLSPPRCAKSRRHRAGNALCIPRRKVQQYRCIKKLFLLDALIMILMGRVELSLCTRSLINVKSKSARADAKLK